LSKGKVRGRVPIFNVSQEKKKAGVSNSQFQKKGGAVWKKSVSSEEKIWGGQLRREKACPTWREKGTVKCKKGR